MSLTAVLAYALTWVARGVGPRLGWVDRPDGIRKLHAKATPLMGGAAVYVALLCGFAALQQFHPAVLTDVAQAHASVVAFLASAGLFCLLGLYDDRWPLKARSKLVLQVVACLPFVFWGPTVTTVSFLGIDLQLGSFAGLFMIVWLVGCANVINLLDGLDGLSASVGVTAMGALAWLALMSGNVAIASIALISCGSLLGFLVHNWPPAKIFLGDAGSLTIGFLIGALSLQSSLKAPTAFALAWPIVIMSVPIFDTFMAILRRRLNGQRVVEPDSAHIHHQLQSRGLNRTQTLAVIAFLSLTTALVGIAAAYFRSEAVAILLCGVILGLVVWGRVFGHTETALLAKRIQLACSVQAKTRFMLNDRIEQLRALRTDSTSVEAWKQLCIQAHGAGVSLLEAVCRDDALGDSVEKDRWIAPGSTDDRGDQPRMSTMDYGRTSPAGLHYSLHVELKHDFDHKTHLASLLTLFDAYVNCRCKELRRTRIIPFGESAPHDTAAAEQPDRKAA